MSPCPLLAGEGPTCMYEANTVCAIHVYGPILSASLLFLISIRVLAPSASQPIDCQLLPLQTYLPSLLNSLSSYKATSALDDVSWSLVLPLLDGVLRSDQYEESLVLTLNVLSTACCHHHAHPTVSPSHLPRPILQKPLNSICSSTVIASFL